MIAQEKRSVESNKICQHCGARFVKKSNRDRHVAIIHRDEPLAPLMSIQGAEEGELHEEVGSTLTPEQIIAATDDVIENNGMVSNVNESEVVFDASIGEQEVVYDISIDEEPVVNNDETMADILAVLSTIHEQGTKCCENTFITKVVEKISADLKGRFAKHNAAKFLVDSLGDLIKDTNFKSWLSQGLNYQPCRLQQIIKNYIQSENYKARHSLSANTHQKIYNFWLKPENSVTSTDRRSGRDEVRLSKRKYLEEYRHLQSIQDENKEMKEITLKKTGTKKTYMYAQRMVYTQPVRKLFDLFKEEEREKCSLSTFIKYKPFYITSPKEREKESCLCKRFLNIHLLLNGVNNFRKTIKLQFHTSVTTFVQNCQVSYTSFIASATHDQ